MLKIIVTGLLISAAATLAPASATEIVMAPDSEVALNPQPLPPRVLRRPGPQCLSCLNPQPLPPRWLFIR